MGAQPNSWNPPTSFLTSWNTYILPKLQVLAAECWAVVDCRPDTVPVQAGTQLYPPRKGMSGTLVGGSKRLLTKCGNLMSGQQ